MVNAAGEETSVSVTSPASGSRKRTSNPRNAVAHLQTFGGPLSPSPVTSGPYQGVLDILCTRGILCFRILILVKHYVKERTRAVLCSGALHFSDQKPTDLYEPASFQTYGA